MTSNIKYKTDQISRYYGQNRIKWDQFYPSEQIIFEKIAPKETDQLLDVGCGCAGLGLALRERFGIKHYTGVEINSEAARLAREMLPEAKILDDDILSCTELPLSHYDLVVSLSCIDWNVEFHKMFTKLFSYVKPGGYVICSFRVTLDKTIVNINDSYQTISFDEQKDDEVAPYVVLNIHELWKLLKSDHPSEISSYGFWGTPSNTAVTPYDKICFMVCALKKGNGDSSCHYDLELPNDVLDQLIPSS